VTNGLCNIILAATVSSFVSVCLTAVCKQNSLKRCGYIFRQGPGQETFLQRVSIACYADHAAVVNPSVSLSQTGIVSK